MGLFRSLADLFRPSPKAPSQAITVRTVGGTQPSGDVRGPLVMGSAGRVWELSDRDVALRDAEAGQFHKVADLCDAMRGDGLIRGLLSTRGAGMWALPTLFDGDPWLCDTLRGKEAEYDPNTGACLVPRLPGMWERLLPLAETAAVVEDGIMAGAGVGYLEDDPTTGGWRRLKRLDLQWLQYCHSTDEWKYQDARRGLLNVTPGDGRWVLFTPYGRSRPWARGAWFPCAGPFISKQGATIDRTRWSKFLADGLRTIKANENASEMHLGAMVEFIRTGWSYAPGIVLPKGYEADIVESGGKGFEVYEATEDRGDREIVMALAGQTVTTEGGKGFSSGDVWRDIAAALIQVQAKVAAEWIGSEVLDPWTRAIGLGIDIVRASWDTRDPAQRQAATEAAKSAAESIDALDKVAERRGKRVKASAFFLAHGVAVELEDIASPPATAPALPSAASSVGGISVVVENQKGTVRTGLAPDGSPWATTMLFDYGYLPGTIAPDGEPVDVYVGPTTTAPLAFIISQLKKDGSPDEPKVLLGFGSEQKAKGAYLSQVPAWCFGGIEAIPVDQLLARLSVATSALAALLPGRVSR